MGDHVNNQHYVPQFLLSYFADVNHNIWCYDKQWKKIYKKGIGGVAYEKHLYDKVPGIKEGSLEYVYQRAETHTAPIIQKIITQRTLDCINLNEKVALAMFIVMQLNRTKTALKNTERFQQEFWEPIKEFAKATGANLDSEPEPSKDLWFSTLDNTPMFAEILLKKIWHLAASDEEFYTSDHPIVKGNYKNRAISQIRGVLGLNSDGIEIYFPLTPSLLLCILCERSYTQPNDDIVLYQAQNTEYVNHLQVHYADKYIFSSQNSFTLAKDMLQNGG